jgi:LuxR family maltose regulon positive regulatory protein
VAGLTLRTSPPTIPPRFVRRPRVDAALSRAAAGAVTLVSAGPGYGKTLGLAHWARHGDPPGRVAWLSVDGSDDSLPGFWSALLGAVQVSGAVPAAHALLGLQPAASFGPAEAAGVIDGLAALPDPLVIVLDDVQQLRDRDLLHSIDLLLERRPPGLHVVLSARYDPPLRLRRLAVADGLTELRSRELAFTTAEARDLLAGSDLPLPDPVVDALVERTRGWAAGLRLAAMSLGPHTSEADVTRLRGSDRPVAEYLLEEVLDQLTADDRRFLLFSSVADPVCAGLASALTGDDDAQSRLARLEGHNAFLVGLAGDRTWFGWHPLFRELLAHRLKIEAPGMAGQLHRRAAAWLEADGDHVAAIGQLTEAGDWASIGRLITERAAPDLVAAQGGALVDALEPTARRSRVDPTPATLLASALWNFRRFDYDAMLRDTNSAALAAADRTDGSTDNGTDGSPATGSPDPSGIDVLVVVLRMAYARARDPRSLVATAGEALELIDRVPRHRVPRWSGTGRSPRRTWAPACSGAAT